jgi:hypothetical protein
MAADSGDNEHELNGYHAEYHCLGCGYGIAIVDPPVSCPMCSATTWMWTTAGTAPAIAIERLANGRAIVAPMGPLDQTGHAALRVAVTQFAANGIEVLVDLAALTQTDALDGQLLRELAGIAKDVDASLVASTDAAAVDLVRADAG